MTHEYSIESHGYQIAYSAIARVRWPFGLVVMVADRDEKPLKPRFQVGPHLPEEHGLYWPHPGEAGNLQVAPDQLRTILEQADLGSVVRSWEALDEISRERQRAEDACGGESTRATDEAFNEIESRWQIARRASNEAEAKSLHLAFKALNELRSTE